MSKRSYKQNCTLALAGDILCERWTLLIFRELFIQPCRFKDLNIWLVGMGTNLLSQRLKELESEGFIEKRDAGDKRSPYQLSGLGRSIEPIVLSLIRWGYQHLQGELGYRHFHHWDLLAMKALFIPEQCHEAYTIQFSSKDLSAWVCVKPKDFSFGLGKAAEYHQELAMTIADFQRALREGAFAQDQKILQFIACFAHDN